MLRNLGNNIFKEGELFESSVRKESLLTAADGKKYRTKVYNLDVIISVGYRVKSKRGTQFRQWANGILKEYLLRGYVVNQRILTLEHQVADLTDKVDFFGSQWRAFFHFFRTQKIRTILTNSADKMRYNYCRKK